MDFDPRDLPRTAELRAWYSEHANDIPAIGGGGSADFVGAERKTIQEMIDEASQRTEEMSAKGIYFTTVAFIKEIAGNRYFYNACPKCNKKVAEEDGMGDSGFYCKSCQAPVEKPLPRYVLSPTICDTTGELRVMAFEPAATKIMGAEAAVVDLSDPSRPDDAMQNEFGKFMKDFFDCRVGSEWLIRLHAKPETYQDETRTKYRVMSVDPLTLCDGGPCKQLVTEARLRLDFIREHTKPAPGSSPAPGSAGAPGGAGGGYTGGPPPPHYMQQQQQPPPQQQQQGYGYYNR
eukprot:GHVU01126072.1.p1 GENE.GHVU01126072.1~~GHVU01126072.1.p1  ORF type:complete len:290 (-),score=61.77 GHVU01126072.1:283-1152(-)